MQWDRYLICFGIDFDVNGMKRRSEHFVWNRNGDKEQDAAYSVADIAINHKVDDDEHHDVHQQRAVHDHCGQFVVKMRFIPVLFHRVEVQQ